MTVKAKFTTSLETSIDFGVQDAEGRALGVILTYGIYLLEEEVPNLKPGTYYTWEPQTIRNGKRFGASQHMRYCSSDKERVNAVEKYIKSAIARAHKSVSKI